MKSRYLLITILCVVFFTSTTFVMAEEDDILLLKIGDPKLKLMKMSVSKDMIYSAQTAKSISLSEMINEIKENQIFYIGETHTIQAIHDIQLEIIQALYRSDPELMIGLEMIPVTQQEVLNKWTLGILSKEELIRELRWYEVWNYNFKYYEGIFAFAKENKIPMYGLNVPRNLISKIRTNGWESLSENDKRIVPKPDLSNKEHKALIRAIFGSSSESPHKVDKEMDMLFEGLYRAQSAWDESMAFHILKAVKRSGKKMTVLVGAGHLIYNLGTNYRMNAKSGLPYKTIVCVEIPSDQDSVSVSRSYADYVWGIEEEKNNVYPLLRLNLKKIEGLDNLIIERKPIEGIAVGKNFEQGDIILSVNDKAFTEINELMIYLSEFRWGDEVTFRLLRAGRETKTVLKFQLGT